MPNVCRTNNTSSMLYLYIIIANHWELKGGQKTHIMVLFTIIVGAVLFGVTVVAILNLLKVDISLLYLIGILMALILFGTEIALLFHLENGSKLGLVIYSGITCIVAVVLTIVAFEKESNVKASGSRHSRVRVQSYNTTSRHRAPQRRHHATRPTRRGRR